MSKRSSLKIFFHSLYAVWLARLREFYRDKSSFYWHWVLPIFIIIAFYITFGNDQRSLFKVGVVGSAESSIVKSEEFFKLDHIRFLPQEKEEGISKVRNHKLDLLVELSNPTQYWVNDSNKNGSIVEKLFQKYFSKKWVKQSFLTTPLSYMDWVFPGILALNIMFGCLWGVGYMIVVYREEGYLKRLHATPLKSYSFLLGQLLSRLVIVLTTTTFIFAVGSFLISLKTQGSYLSLIICYTLGAISLSSIGLFVASRTKSKEFADQLLNVFTWPFFIFSEMWFSLEGSSLWIQTFSKILPLTHLIAATREIILEGATLYQVRDHLGAMVLFSIITLTLTAILFKWNDR